MASNRSWRSADGSASILQGDALALLAQMQEASVDCVWTDPPYHLSNDGITCKSGKMTSVNKGKWDRSRGPDEDFAFVRAWMSEVLRVLRPGGTAWVSGTVHVYPMIGFAMQKLGMRILNDIVWEKPAPPPNLGCRCFTHASEIILWATKPDKKAKYRFDYKAMVAENGGTQMRNVWRGISPPNAEEKAFGKHPTQKPVRLVERCLRASTLPGDLVLDPFMGSGTTGVAAAKLGRRFVGLEAEREFCNLAARRISATLALPKGHISGTDQPRMPVPSGRAQQALGL